MLKSVGWTSKRSQFRKILKIDFGLLMWRISSIVAWALWCNIYSYFTVKFVEFLNFLICRFQYIQKNSMWNIIKPKSEKSEIKKCFKILTSAAGFPPGDTQTSWALAPSLVFNTGPFNSIIIVDAMFSTQVLIKYY